ncbi:universal stress protein [bacterium]|nr:universal stress protein [bacterium]
MFSRILVPVDGSSIAEQALESAVKLAKTFGASLHLVQVAPGPVSGDYIVDVHLHEAVLRRERERLQTHLDKLGDQLTQTGLSVTTRLLEPGTPGPELVAEIERDPVDLVVMTSHGRTGVARMFLGSVAEYVARHAPCPTLIVRPKKDEGHD